MKFSVSKEIFDHFAELSIGVIIADNIENTGKSEDIEKLLSEIIDVIKQSQSPTEFANNSLISPWKSAFFDYDKKPIKTHSSVEYLTKTIFNKGDIARFSKLKDLCSFISLKNTVPVISFDVDKITAEFSLIRAKGDEFLYGSGETLHPEKGEFIYMDSTNVLSRKFDSKETEKAIVDNKTKKAVILIEGLGPLLKSKIEDISKESVDLVKIFCKGDVHFLVLDKDNPVVEF